ncbi:portal protein [Gluconobacter oxydans]|uniref:portal protein n=1 Tax=Gluconobacter oxydans TaxID=442 RepID=UPI00062C727C|nr:portal protein [Gluconobacter oxydans]
MSTQDDEILKEVVERHRHCQSVEASARANYRADLQFLYGDAYNQAQWEPAVVMARTGAGGSGGRPCLTVNKTLQHVLQVTNSARQQTMGVKIVATGFGASQKAAEVLEGIIRHIEAQSNAQQNAYANAIMGQVGGGIGYTHIVTDYVRGVDTFDQDLFIETVPDPLCVMLDPDAQEPDKSDANWGMLITHMPRGEFERMYARDKDIGDDHPFDGVQDHDGGWEEKDRVRIARYYRRSEVDDTLWNVPPVPDMGIRGGPMRESEMPDGMAAMCRKMKCEHRPVSDHAVEWFLIGGSRVLDHGDTVFKNIPLVPWIGIETNIDGKLDRKGLTRLLVDPQRMFNFSASKFIEGLAAQTMGSWIASDAQVKGRESEWAMANISPPGVLVYNSEDPDSGALVNGAPEPVPPPQFSPGYLQAMQQSDQQMQMASGQYQAEMGAPSNEKSGRAIGERQRQSDTANYHFTDNQGMALRLTGKILIDAIPRVYDVTRAVQVMGIDGTMAQAIIDPQITQAHQQVTPQGAIAEPQSPDPEAVADVKGAILAINPNVGRYDVIADVGPSWASQTQETFNALMQVVQADPALMAKCGDLLFRSAPFPLASEIADRLKPIGDDPQAAAVQQQLQQAQQLIAQLQQQLKNKQQDFDLRADKQHHDQIIDLMDQDTRKREQQTDEMAAIGSISPESLRPVLVNLIRTILAEQGTPNTPVPEVTTQPLERLPSTNPPGGEIHAPNPVTGAVDA